MPPAPISENPPLVVADETEFDALLGVYTLFFRIPRSEVVYFRIAVESWEECAVPRTMQKVCDDDATRTIVVAMAVPDHLGVCLRRLARLAGEIGGVQVRSTPWLRERLRRDLMDPPTGPLPG